MQKVIKINNVPANIKAKARDLSKDLQETEGKISFGIFAAAWVMLIILNYKYSKGKL